MSLEKKTDYVEQGLDRLLEQYKGKIRIEGLLTPWLKQAQIVEDIAWEVITLRYLDTAEGVQLDVLGKIVGRKRAQLDDDTYRLRLKVQILINRSDGCPPTVQKVARLILAPTYDYTYSELDIQTLRIEIATPITSTMLDVIFEALTEAKAGGVKLEVSYVATAERAFKMAAYDPDDPTYAIIQRSTTHGLADYPVTFGGRLTALRSS